jgi:glycosyltransferase involved in cell wall biosynthesis
MSTVQRELLDLADDGQLQVRHVASYTDRSRPAMVATFAAALRSLRAETAVPGRVDVVHLHLSQRGSFLRGLVVTRSLPARVPLVVTVHGSVFRPFARRYPGLVRSVLQRAGVVTTLSEESAGVVADLGIADVRVVPNFVAVPETIVPVRETGPTVLAAGLISHRKGHDVLFAAWEQVVDRLPEARLLVAGPPGDVAVPDLPGVEPLGAVPREDVLRALREARVGVLASRWEGLPMFVLETMAAGRPVVTTDIESVSVVVSDGGWIVPPGDVDALAAALLVPLRDAAEAARVGDRAQRIISSRYSREVVGRTWRELYAEVAAL